MGELNQKALHLLIEQIYRASIAPEQYVDFLAALQGRFDATAATLARFDVRAGGAPWITSVDLCDDTDRRDFEERWAGRDPWTLTTEAVAIERGPGTAGPSQELLSDRDLERTAFYNEFGRKVGQHHGAALLVDCAMPQVVELSLLRGESQPDFSKGECDFLRALWPHLRRSVRIAGHVMQLEDRVAAHEEALDELPVGVVLVDGDACVVFANTAARCMFREPGHLGLQAGRLSVPGLRAQQQVDEVVQAALGSVYLEGPSTGGAAVFRQARCDARIEILVTPIDRGSPIWPTSRPRAMLVISDGSEKFSGVEPTLIRLFALTPAEAQLARLLLEGHSLAQAAECRGVTETTVRSQLKTIFSKTETRSQADLVRMLLLGVARFAK